MTRYRLPALLALLLPLVAGADDTPAKPTMASVLASAPAEDWMPVAADRLLVMSLDRGQVLIELAPAFAPHRETAATLPTQVNSTLHIGGVYIGRVTSLKSYGAFVDLGNRRSGLVFIKEISFCNIFK